MLIFFFGSCPRTGEQMERKEGGFYRDKIIAVSSCKVSLAVAEK